MIHPEDLGEYNWYHKRFEDIQDHFLAEKVMKNSISIRKGKKSLTLENLETKPDTEENQLTQVEKDKLDFINFFTKKAEEIEKLKTS